MVKRILCAALLVISLLAGCTTPQSGGSTYERESGDYITGVWFSYTEIDAMLGGDFKAEFSAAIQSCKELSVTDIFVHVRPFCDAIYKSQYFPLRANAAAQDFDVLEYMISAAHDSGIRLHAWINPYRVSHTADTAALPQGSPALELLSEAGNTSVVVSEGIYLNPAAPDARRLVIDGIREIVANYEVDGIHFDDYFYPTTDAAFDSADYGEYCQNTKQPLSLADWRRANVNALISGSFTAVKFQNKDIIFSVSPAAGIDNNYNELYADSAAWVENGCVDWLIPQLYFGFDYPVQEYRFETLLKAWKKLVRDSETQLIIGLAPYKIGTESEPDRDEWNNNLTLLKRQAQMCYGDSAVAGHIFFSYSSLFSEAPQNTAAREALK